MQGNLEVRPRTAAVNPSRHIWMDGISLRGATGLASIATRRALAAEALTRFAGIPLADALRPASKRVDDFLAKFDPAKPRIIFCVDATASRQPTWDSAAMLQAQMFHAAAGLECQLAYWRNYNEFRATQWFSDPQRLAEAMAKITCVAGHTQIGKALRHAAREHAAKPIAALILITDSCEEEESALYAAARKLPVPVFMFQEGRSELVARIYARIAEVTGGALAQFDSSSAAKLGELLKAVAVFAQGGVKALEAQGGAAARLLIEQIRK